MKRLLLSFVVLLLTMLVNRVGQAQSADRIFEAANTAYYEGKHTEAAQRYRSLIQAGFRDADLYVNLALAEAQADRLGRAIYYFERALAIRPADETALRASELVRAEIARRRSEHEEEAFVSDTTSLRALLRPFSENGIAAWFLGLELMVFFAAFVAIRARGASLKVTAITTVVLSLGLLSVAGVGVLGKLGLFQNGPFAIVLEDRALREGPSERARSRSRVLEGDEATVLETRDGYALVRTEKHEGWIEHGLLGVIHR